MTQQPPNWKGDPWPRQRGNHILPFCAKCTSWLGPSAPCPLSLSPPHPPPPPPPHTPHPTSPPQPTPPQPTPAHPSPPTLGYLSFSPPPSFPNSPHLNPTRHEPHIARGVLALIQGEVPRVAPGDDVPGPLQLVLGASGSWHIQICSKQRELKAQKLQASSRVCVWFRYPPVHEQRNPRAPF